MKKYICLFTMIPLIAFAQKEETITSGNSKMHFRTFGTGKPLLILNGGPGMNSEGFTFIAEELSKFNCQTITFDQRGTGRSTIENPDSQNITMDLMVEDMENLRTHLKIEKWTILGHSFGGVLAAYYATKHPERIEKLIMSSSGGINMNFVTYVSKRINDNLTPTQRDSFAYFQHKRDNGDVSVATLKKRAKYLANAYVYDKTKAPIIAERLIQINYEVNALVIQNLLDIKFNCAGKFKNFNQPVLVLQGENDIITVETAKEIVKAFPNSNLVTMPNCAHYGWLDAPDIYFNAVKSFLNS
jgi:proline iminopeptidase